MMVADLAMTITFALQCMYFVCLNVGCEEISIRSTSIYSELMKKS